MEITLTREQVLKFAKVWQDQQDDIDRQREKTARKFTSKARKRGYLRRKDLMEVAAWKSPRIKGLLEKDDLFIKEFTGLAFDTKDERVRMEALKVIRGIDWPMASVVLHLCFPKRYPVLDVNAMMAVGGDQKYTFDKWQEYCSICRKKADEFDVSLNVLDQALWISGKAQSAS